MGDRSPKDKMKKKQQHDKELKQKEQAKVVNMQKNRPVQAAGGAEEQKGDYKKAG
jgi:hypothetical protein